MDLAGREVKHVIAGVETFRLAITLSIKERKISLTV
jgi:hypothetical protein